MSLRLSAVRPLAVLTLLGLAAASAPTRAALLDKAVRESQDPAKNNSLISAYVNDQVTKMVGKDQNVAQTARMELVENVRTSPVIAPSAQFKDIYSGALNSALTPHIKSTDVNVRLLAAISAARVAAETRSPSLRGVLTIALEDNSRAVCLWGVKGAGRVLPQVLANALAAKNERLSSGVISAVQRFGDMTPIADEAYTAGEMGLQADPPDASINFKAVAPTAVDVTQKVLRERVQDYAALPASQPQLEGDAVAFLTRTRMWQEHTPAQKLATVELALHVLNVSAHRLNDTQVPDRNGLIDSIKRAAGGLSVAVGGANPGLKSALDRMTKLPPNAQGAAVLASVDALFPQIKAMKEYSAVSNPPTVVPAAGPATAPAKPTPPPTPPTPAAATETPVETP